MIWIVFIVIVFLILLLFPILLSMFWYYHSNDSVLMISKNINRDPRYFGKSFEKLFLKAWEERKDDILLLSKPEHYLMADEMKSKVMVYDEVIIAEKEKFKPPAGVRFNCGIFAYKDVFFQANTQLRAIRTYGDLVLEHNVTVERWADADGTVKIDNACNLGISISSGKEITIGKNCKFRRLFAPVIHTGCSPNLTQKPMYQRQEYIYSIGYTKERRRNRQHIGYLDADDAGVAHSSFVTEAKIIIDEDIVVQGDVRSYKSVQLSERAVVCGNIFAEGEVYLSRNSTVLGNVFTQGDIYCENGVVIGKEDQISSMIARGRIALGENCSVYGYISNEAGGVTCPICKIDCANSEQSESLR